MFLVECFLGGWEGGRARGGRERWGKREREVGRESKR